MKRLWTEPRATFEWQFYRLQNASMEPKPVQKAHPLSSVDRCPSPERTAPHGRAGRRLHGGRRGCPSLGSEALLDVLDAGLERGNPLLQFAKVALEDLAPPPLVSEASLDPAQSVRDRLVLLLEALESPVDLIEVPEHVASQLGELAAELTTDIVGSQTVRY